MSLIPNWDERTAKPVVWINGWPAVGKTAVASFIKNLISSRHAVLVNEDGEADTCAASEVEMDRHARCDDDPAAEEEASAAARRTDAFARHILAESSWSSVTIFTACQPATAKGSAIAKEYAAASRAAGRLFVPVTLLCDEDENLRRLVRLARYAAIAPPQDAVQLRAVRSLGLFQFPAPASVTTAATAAQASSSSSESSSGTCLPPPPHDAVVDDDSPGSNALVLDITRMNAITAGTAIKMHLDSAIDRQRCRLQRAFELAQAEAAKAEAARTALALAQRKAQLMNTTMGGGRGGTARSECSSSSRVLPPPPARRPGIIRSTAAGMILETAPPTTEDDDGRGDGNVKTKGKDKGKERKEENEPVSMMAIDDSELVAVEALSQSASRSPNRSPNQKSPNRSWSLGGSNTINAGRSRPRSA